MPAAAAYGDNEVGKDGRTIRKRSPLDFEVHVVVQIDSDDIDVAVDFAVIVRSCRAFVFASIRLFRLPAKPVVAFWFENADLGRGEGAHFVTGFASIK